MARFQKSILRCGTYHSLDGAIQVTPARLRHWVQQFNRFQKSGNVVPVSFDHDENRLTPLSLNEFRSSKDTVGRLAELSLSPDGQSAQMTLDISDAKASELAKSNDVFVSPVLCSEWQDGNKRKFRDLWSHVDIVNHPVDNSQGPFIALSNQRKPIKHWRFSLMADDLLDDELETVDALDDGMEEAESAELPIEETASVEVPDEFEPSYSNIDEIQAELAQIGILLGDDTNDGNFMDRLLPALKTFIAQKNAMDAMDEQLEVADAPLEMEQQQFQQMSLASQNLFRSAQENHRNQVKQSLAKLFNNGQCSPKEYREMGARINTVRLSLATGKPKPTAVEEWIKSRQAVPKGSFWDAKKKTQRMSLENRPKELTGDQMSDKEVDETANRIARRVS